MPTHFEKRRGPWLFWLVIIWGVLLGFAAGQPVYGDGPDFRIIGVTAEYGQLIVEVQHFDAAGEPWFFEDYTFQGREAFKYQRGSGRAPKDRQIDEGSILHTIASIHRQRLLTGWDRGKQRLTTTPMDSRPKDRDGSPLLWAQFNRMTARSYVTDEALFVAEFGPPVPPADMTVGPESGTVSIFYPDPDIESTSADGEAWGHADSKELTVAVDSDDVTHASTHAITHAELIASDQNIGVQWDSFIRYANVTIPNAANITSAFLIFTPSASMPSTPSDTDMNTRIFAEDDDNAGAIVDDTGWHNQNLTTASVFNADLPIWVTNKKQHSDDISAVVQEVIDRPGFASGNNVGFYWFEFIGLNEGTRRANQREIGTAVVFHAEWERASVPGDVWANLLTNTGSYANDYFETAVLQLKATATTGRWERLARTFFNFDTSALPDADNIDSATFEFVATSTADALTPAQSISLVTAAPASNIALVGGDFDSLGTVLQATDLTIASLTADSATFNTYTLNETGEGNISRTGITNFAVQLASDFSGTEPTWASGSSASVIFVTSEETLAGDKRPKLTVTHASRGSGGTTPLSGTRVSPAIDLSSVTAVAYCAIGWEAFKPPGTTVTVETSLDGGTTYSSAADGFCPPGITIGASLATVTDFRTKVTLTTIDDTITPLMTALGLIVADESGQELHYQLITTPAVFLTDRSGNSNFGTMSFPLTNSDITADVGSLTSTRAGPTVLNAISVPAVASAVTGSATSDNIFAGDPGTDLPGFGLLNDIATLSDLPVRALWMIIGSVIILSIAVVIYTVTKTLLFATIALGLGLTALAVMSSGLVPGFTIFLAVPLMLVFLWLRPKVPV